MAEHNEIGKKGEAIAKQYLEEKGYTILELNWRFKKAEIDIIAKDVEEDVLVFVEVKTRSSNAFGSPEEFVTDQKEKLMGDAAYVYAGIIQHDWEIRFDIIAVLLENDTPQISHLPDAFFPYEF